VRAFEISGAWYTGDEFKNEFKRSSKDVQGRLGTLDDDRQLLYPQASLNIPNESTSCQGDVAGSTPVFRSNHKST
jgi:hypothetical protein